MTVDVNKRLFFIKNQVPSLPFQEVDSEDTFLERANIAIEAKYRKASDLLSFLFDDETLPEVVKNLFSDFPAQIISGNVEFRSYKVWLASSNPSLESSYYWRNLIEAKYIPQVSHLFRDDNAHEILNIKTGDPIPAKLLMDFLYKNGELDSLYLVHCLAVIKAAKKANEKSLEDFERSINSLIKSKMISDESASIYRKKAYLINKRFINSCYQYEEIFKARFQDNFNFFEDSRKGREKRRFLENSKKKIIDYIGKIDL